MLTGNGDVGCWYRDIIQNLAMTLLVYPRELGNCDIRTRYCVVKIKIQINLLLGFYSDIQIYKFNIKQENENPTHNEVIQHFSSYLLNHLNKIKQIIVLTYYVVLDISHQDYVKYVLETKVFIFRQMIMEQNYVYIFYKHNILFCRNFLSLSRLKIIL